MRDAISTIISSVLAGLQASSPDQTKSNIEDLLQAAAALLGQFTVETYPPGVTLCVSVCRSTPNSGSASSIRWVASSMAGISWVAVWSR